MKTGKQIKTQIRRIARAIQTRIDFIQQTASKGTTHVMGLDDSRASFRRAGLQKRFRRLVDCQFVAGLSPARRLMESSNYRSTLARTES